MWSPDLINPCAQGKFFASTLLDALMINRSLPQAKTLNAAESIALLRSTPACGEKTSCLANVAVLMGDPSPRGDK